MTPAELRERFASRPVAHLATADGAGRPHLVPMVFVVLADTVYSAVDAKPKRGPALRRLANVAVNPQVAVLVDHYDEDWSRLWWVRADGIGRVLEATEVEARTAVDALVARYDPYRRQRPGGPVLAVDVHRWSGWSAG